MNDKRVLYFFTGSFPYNLNGETYINNEFPFLSNSFKKIIIIPLFAQKKSFSNIPDNCIVLKPLIKNKWQHYILGLIGIKSLPVYIKEFFLYKVYKSKKRLLQFYSDYCTTNIVLQSFFFRRILKDVGSNDVLYFYWGKGISNCLPFIRATNAKRVVRWHGGDLYDCNYGGYIPLQSEILKNVDLSIFISKHGQNFLLNRFHRTNIKSVVSYLGTEDFGTSNKSNDSIFRLLSCSNVVPEKRVHLIFEAIQLLKDINIEWTHIGDGVDFELLKSKVQQSNSNIKITLLGRLTNDAVFDFYSRNSIDVFINVSVTEGLPISLMEAISFNVPVIATNVGGTSEIINRSTGILISANPLIKEIADAVIGIQKLQFEPRKYWFENFNAKNNFNNFISILHKL
jgi:colanic acid/amylovoran biosynthesis glycosyltransferase